MLAVSGKVKDTPSLQPSQFPPRYLPKRNGSIFICKDMHRNVDGSFFGKSQKLQMTQMTTKLVYPYSGKLLSNKKDEFLINPIIWI